MSEEITEPSIQFIKRAELSGPRLGIFASSFNPTTTAHVELMRRAASCFLLDETLALAGLANADKSDYECSLEDRLHMLALTFAGEQRVSIGVSSHAFFVDMIDALKTAYPSQTDLHFVVGFDTFERVVDLEERYRLKYHRRFSDRAAALQYLLVRSRLVVAGRRGSGENDIRALVERDLKGLAERVSYLDAPAEITEMSATRVRDRIRAGLAIDGLVPPAVELYIKEKRLYTGDRLG
ncbi:MAG TPA: nicotinate-nicotinamide nucleotide adenylyltransferase [Blastocatellia bacterium]|nr:nicotinate-nicotinamide nucleotide adenylyltransferase [Blastocatellia bacterium]